MALKEGFRLGPYEIVAPLGAGGMGEVYQARDTRLDRSVAIKILPSHLSGDPSSRQRFEREARAVSALNHPHICVLHDVGREDEVDYLVMEHLEGETLTERMGRGPIPVAELLRHATQIADALDKAHRQGVVHRDLKPGNIMLTRSGVKLLDFGLARIGVLSPNSDATGLTALPTTAGADLTEAGTILGTVQYMSPEQLEGKEADSRADIFAMGAVIYEMASGRRAFAGKSQANVIAAILEHDPPPLSAEQPMAPPALDRVVRVCLAKDPDERWQTAHDVKLQLEWVAETGGDPAGGAAVATPVSAGRAGREKAAWGVAGLLLLTTLVAAWVALGGGASETPERALRSVIPTEPGTRYLSDGDFAGPAVVSPDGRRLAWVALDETGLASVWVRDLGELAAKRVPGTEGAQYPFWSPDGRSLGFFTTDVLKRVDVDGSALLSLATTNMPRGGSWSNDGFILYAPEFISGLNRVSATGGEPEEVTGATDTRYTTHRWPHMLPDGKHFLFTAANHAVRREDEAIFLGSIDGEEPRMLVRSSAHAVYAGGRMLFLRGDSLVAQTLDLASGTLVGEPELVAENVEWNPDTWRGAFAASDEFLVYRVGGSTARNRLIWYDRHGKELDRVGDVGSFRTLEISPDGKRVVVSAGDPLDLWVYDLERADRTRVTFDPEGDYNPIWLPDGDELLFSKNIGGEFQTYRTHVDSRAGSREFMAHEEMLFITDVSADGRELLFSRGLSGGVDISAVSLEEGGEMRSLTDSGFDEVFPRFSPDGRWITYQSNETGFTEVYVTSYPDLGRRYKVSRSGGTTPRWRRDGRGVYFWSPRGFMATCPITVRGEELEIGLPEELFPIYLEQTFHSYDVSTDGERFLLIVSEQEQSAPMVLVSGWPADLAGS